jgi:glycosyltransferase involved in cell wall biosynthesis
VKILYVAPYASDSFLECQGDTQTGGLAAQRKIELICEGICDQGHEVMVLSSFVTDVPFPFWRRPYQERMASGRHSIPVYYPALLGIRAIGSLLNGVRAGWIARTAAASFLPDMILLYNTNLFEFQAAGAIVNAKPCPIVLEIEDLPRARRRGWWNFKPWIDQLCWDRLLRACRGYTAVNRAIKDMLPDRKPSLLLPGIIDDRLLEMAAQRSPAFTGQRRTFGYFGGLSQDKGVMVLADLAKELPDPWDILVCGGGPLAPLFHSLARQRPGRFTFLGSVPSARMYEAMCRCDCTMVPPERIAGDGSGVFPFKVFEYLAAGTHVIAPPLKTLPDFGIDFINRWDGRADSLPGLLERAEADFFQEAPERRQAVDTLCSRYRVSQVGEQIQRMFLDMGCA